MTRTTSLTIAAIVVATIASSAVPALAQDLNPTSEGKRIFRHHEDGPRLMVHRMDRDGGGLQLLALACSDRGADRLEHMLLSIEQRTDVTATQQPLFDTFESAAIKAQSDFAATCTAARPSDEERGTLDLAERLATGLDVQKAQVAAMETVIPAFTAFYDSLTDEQKQALEPSGREHRRDMGELRAPDLPPMADDRSAPIGPIDG